MSSNSSSREPRGIEQAQGELHGRDVFRQVQIQQHLKQIAYDSRVVQGVNGMKVGASVRPAARNSRTTSMKSARVWPLSSFASTASSTDSTALVTNRQPVSRRRGNRSTLLQQVLDLDGGVVGERRKFLVQRFDDAHGVRGAVEEIGIAEGDVLGAGCDLLANVLQHNFRLHHAKIALIHRHHRAMPAQVLAAAAGFGVAGALGQPVDLQSRIFFERRQTRRAAA